MSGVVFLPSQSKRRRLHQAVARLCSALHRRPAAQCGPAPADPADRGEAGGLYPISAPHSGSEPRGPRPRELRVRCQRSGAGYVVELSGALSAGTCALLTEALEDALETDTEEIALDLGDLESIDGAGLSSVLTGHLRASDELRRLVIIPGPEPVQRVFDDARGPFLYATRKVAPTRHPRSRGRRKARATPPRPGTRRGATW